MFRLKPFVIVGLVGLAVIRGASQDARAVLADADRGVYTAKAFGRNRVADAFSNAACVQ